MRTCTEQCQSVEPVLTAPDFTKLFQLEVDASTVGAGELLLQDHDVRVGHPVCYCSHKFNRHQVNYSTFKKDALTLLLALQHFNVYVRSNSLPVIVYTDHNPLVFFQRMYNQYQQLMQLF